MHQVKFDILDAEKAPDSKRTRRSFKADQAVIDTGLGDRVRVLREAAGLTQDQLGAAAGCTSAHIGDIERGKTVEPRSTLLRAIANVVGVHPALVMLSSDEIEEFLQARCPGYVFTTKPALIEVAQKLEALIEDAAQAKADAEIEQMFAARTAKRG